MQVSQKTRILNTLCIVLVLLAGVVRLIGKRNGLFSYNNTIFALFAAFMECLICVRLFPNNDNYGVF